jgi:hypothetical protein
LTAQASTRLDRTKQVGAGELLDGAIARPLESIRRINARLAAPLEPARPWKDKLPRICASIDKTQPYSRARNGTRG